MIRAAFFDAAGHTVRPREPIGRTYARLAREFAWTRRRLQFAGISPGFRRRAGLAFDPGVDGEVFRYPQSVAGFAVGGDSAVA